MHAVRLAWLKKLVAAGWEVYMKAQKLEGRSIVIDTG